MSREASIPLVLWISTATLVHAMGGGSAIEAARTLSDRASVRSMVSELRMDLAPGEGTIEVVTDAAELNPRSEPNPAENPNAKPTDPPKDPPKPDEKKTPPKKAPPRAVVLKPPPKPPEAPKPPPKPPEPPKIVKKETPPPLKPLAIPPKVEAKKPPPPPPPEVAKKEEPEKKAPPPPPPDKRIAVVQDVKKDQPDNPNAKRIADDANTTAEETVARVRAFDGTASAKLEGGRTGDSPDRGNSDENKSGHNEEKQGDKEHAPGENNAKAVASVHSNPAPPAPPAAGAANKAGAPLSVPGNTGGGGNKVVLSPPSPQPPAAASAGGSGPASPEVHSSANGTWSADPANPGGDGTSRVAGAKREAVYQSPVKVQSMGFGAPGLPGGINVNLTMAGLQGAVGEDKLKQERAADGEARRAKHRGAGGAKDKFDWRAAVENYEPSVKPGNQTSLNAAKSAFGTYLNTIHNRIHPIFAEEFLQSLSSLPPGHKLNEHLVTYVEIVLGKDDGKIIRTGITKASGSTMFDLVAVNSARRAGPFGKPPDAIVSHDGKVYIHWEFHRDPYDACSSRNARPYILKPPAEKTEAGPEVKPKPVEAPKPVDERTDPPRTKGPIPLPSERF